MTPSAVMMNLSPLSRVSHLLFSTIPKWQESSKRSSHRPCIFIGSMIFATWSVMKEDARVYGRRESSFEVKGKILPERGLDGDGEIGGDGKRWLLECAFNVEVSVTLEEYPGPPVTT